MFKIEGNYQSCSVCGKLADDGGLKDKKFTCHDCLEKLDEKRKSKLTIHDDSSYCPYCDSENIKYAVDSEIEWIDGVYHEYGQAKCFDCNTEFDVYDSNEQQIDEY